MYTYSCHFYRFRPANLKFTLATNCHRFMPATAIIRWFLSDTDNPHPTFDSETDIT